MVGRDDGGAAIYREQGRAIGWIADVDLYLDPEAAYSEAQMLASSQNAPLSVTKQTLWKRSTPTGCWCRRPRAASP